MILYGSPTVGRHWREVGPYRTSFPTYEYAGLPAAEFLLCYIW
jgi:hypothetical protein